MSTGGATDACHLLGFGDDLSSPCIPSVEAGLHRTVGHIVDGGVEGRFPTVAKYSLPALVTPPRAVLWHEEMLRPEDLFPCWFLDARVFCPSHRMPTRWTIRTLTIGKRLWLYQMPLTLNVVLGDLSSSRWLPFVDSPLPEVYTFIVCQLWGIDGGSEVVAGDVGHNVEEEEEVTDGPLGPSVVDKVVEGDEDATVLAVLPDTGGPSGPSVVDKVVEGDGDATVLVALLNFCGTDGPLGSSDTNMPEGGDGGTKPAGSEWGGTTSSPSMLEIPLVTDRPGNINNDLQSDSHLQEMTATKPDALTKCWERQVDF